MMKEMYELNIAEMVKMLVFYHVMIKTFLMEMVAIVLVMQKLDIHVLEEVQYLEIIDMKHVVTGFIFLHMNAMMGIMIMVMDVVRHVKQNLAGVVLPIALVFAIKL